MPKDVEKEAIITSAHKVALLMSHYCGVESAMLTLVWFVTNLCVVAGQEKPWSPARGGSQRWRGWAKTGGLLDSMASL